MNRIGFYISPVQFLNRSEMEEQAAPVVSDDAPAGRIGFRRPTVDPVGSEDEVVPKEFAAECAADGE